MVEFHEVTQPYPGLRPFESWEGEIFFGREEHTNRLLDILQQQHFLAVIGPSGSGKSSLVRAGLLPALPLGSLGTGSDWRIALMRPGNRPMQRLAHALLGPSALGIELVGEEHISLDERQLTADVALIEAELRRGPLGLVEVVKDARLRETGDESFNLLVLVDQFEEIFTYANVGEQQADESAAFVNLLLASRSEAEARIYIALTMRTDFLGNCVRFLELPDAINRAQYLTPRLTREQIEKTIVGPAHLFDGNVEPSLVAELINAVSNDPDQLPILQHALARMWNNACSRNADPLCITWDDSKAVGGVTDALSRHANEILASLSPKNEIEAPPSPEQRVAEVLFRAITEQRGINGGERAVRRPQSLSQIAQWTGRDWHDFVPAIRAFAQENVNFINYVGKLTEETVIDISHEALIRQWHWLRESVKDEARLAEEYRRWNERATDWVAGVGSLLTGADLARAAEWRDCAKWKTQPLCKPSPEWARRYSKKPNEPSAAEFKTVCQFIDESQQVVLRAEKRERRLKWIMAGLTIISSAAMTVAIEFAYQANERLINAEAAALWHPLDFSQIDSGITQNRESGLLRLARSDESHKKAFLSQLLKGESLAKRFNNNPQAIISGAVGLNLKLRSWFLERLYEIPLENETKNVFHVARALALLELNGNINPEGLIAAIQSTGDSDQLEALGEGLAAVAGKVPEAQAGAVTNQLLVEIQATQNSDQLKTLIRGLTELPIKLNEAQGGALVEKLLTALQTKRIYNQPNPLRQGLAAVAGKVAEAQAGTVTEKLLAAIQATQDSDELQTLGQGLAALPIKLTEAQAGAAINQLVAAIQAARGGDQMTALGLDLAAVASKVTGEQADAMTNQLLAVIQATQNVDELQALSQGLAALPIKLNETQVRPVTNQFVAAIQATQDRMQLEDLSRGLAALPIKLSETQAATVTNQFVAVILSIQDRYHLEDLGQALASVADKVDEAQAGAMTDKLVETIQATQNYDQLSALGLGLAALPITLNEAQARAVTNQLVAAVQDSQNLFQLKAVSHTLTALPIKLNEAQERTVMEKMLSTLQATQDINQLRMFGQSLAAVAGKVAESLAKEMTEKLVETIQATQNSFQLRALGQVLAAVAGKIAEAQTGAMTNQFVVAIHASQDTHQLLALGQGLAALPITLTESQASMVVEKLLAAIQAGQDFYQLQALSQSAAAIAVRIGNDDQAASLLFELLKNPLLPRDELADAIRKHFPDAPREEQGFWALIAWADKRFPHLDLEAPLKEAPAIVAQSPATGP